MQINDRSKMPMSKDRITIIILATLTWCLNARPSFAVPTQFQMIEKLEQEEKRPAPARVERPKVEYTAAGFTDPFEIFLKKDDKDEKEAVSASGEARAKPLPVLTVQGVIWGSGLPLAIINNKVVKSGDIVDGVQITVIKKEGITILFDGQVYNLSSPAAGNTSVQKSQGG